MLPKTPNQVLLMKKLLDMRKPITVVVGPAGWGQTLFACHVAAHRASLNKLNKIIVTRPTVSVDEDLGFLPGKIEHKMEPWLKPMFEIFEKERVHKMVEIVPMSFMRGRTFKNSFIIADEMQNSTPNQMKMILTRIGEDSKMVINGDLTQSDLRTHTNGLHDILKRIGYRDDLVYIDQLVLSSEDVQRHPAVSEVLSIY